MLNSSTSKPVMNTSIGIEVQDHSSLKHVHFVNIITLIQPLRDAKEVEHEALTTIDLKEEIMGIESEEGKN